MRWGSKGGQARAEGASCLNTERGQGTEGAAHADTRIQACPSAGRGRLPGKAQTCCRPGGPLARWREVPPNICFYRTRG